MSTRATIAIKLDNQILGVYLHSDGDTSYAGKILLENYNTEDKVIELISHGFISALYPNIGVKHPFFENILEPDYVEQCRFYHRDRGDKLEFYKAKTEKSFWRLYDNGYNYIFKDGEWYVKEYDKPFVKVADVLKNEE